MIRLSGSVKLSCASSGGTPKSRANGLVPRLLRPSSGVAPSADLRPLPGFEPRFGRRDGREPLLASLQLGRQFVPRTSGLYPASSAASVASAWVSAPRSARAAAVLRRASVRNSWPCVYSPRLSPSTHPRPAPRPGRRRLRGRSPPPARTAPRTPPGAAAKLRDRAVGGKIARRQHAIGDIFFQLPRDPTRRKRPGGIGVNSTVTIIRGSNG